jgi:hypothetical protein
MTASHRMTLTAALASALSSTALYPLFTGSAWFYAGLGAILTVTAAGTLSRLRTLPVLVCLAISVAGLLLYLNLVFEARHSWLRLIPAPGTLSRLWALAGTGFTDLSGAAPPAPERSGLVLLAVGGIAIAALLTDLIAVRLRATALAGLPLLVLFTVPIAINAQHHSVGTLVVFCLATTGYLAMLSADGRERIRVWGRLVSLWRSGGGATPDTRPLAAAGRRVGLTSVVLALCVPLVMPGLHPARWFSSGQGTGGGTAGAGGPSISLTLPSDLKQTIAELDGPVTPVFSYTTTDEPLWASDPPYFRQVVYDNLSDVSGWTTSDYTAQETLATVLPRAQGLDAAVMADAKTVAIAVDVVAKGGLSSESERTFLPVPYPPSQVSPPPGLWAADPELMVFSQDTSVPVKTYEVTSQLVDPSGPQLNQAAPPPPSLAPDEQLPQSYQVLKQIAEAETRGATTEYQKVDQLAAWLSSSPFSYGPAPYFDSAAGLVKFLTKTRTGECVQYAYALTVLARSLGIPARLVAGYTEGSHTSANRWAVRSDDAHAWTEVYFSGYGWITFEATPAGGDGTAHAAGYQTRPPAIRHPGPSPSASAAGHSGGPGGSPGHHPLNDSGPGGSLSAGPAGSPWAAILLTMAAAVALMFLAPALGRRGRGRWRWMHAADDAGRAHAAWREFRDDLRDYGLGYAPSEPPRTLADRIASRLPEPTREAVRRLALAEERASYAARPSGSATLRRDLATARRGVMASARRSTRWRARIFPVSVLTAVAGWRIPIPAVRREGPGGRYIRRSPS